MSDRRSSPRLRPKVTPSLGPSAVELLGALAARKAGETVSFPQPGLRVAGCEFRSASILREFHTKSGARLVQLQPGNRVYICKFDDLMPEYAVMAALRQMNARWKMHRVTVCGELVQAVTFGIIPFGHQAGLVEAVPDSRTLRELSQGLTFSERQFRVLRALQNDDKRLDRLAASTVAWLTAGYALGVRDGHDDNIMLRSDGCIFRVDFGFAFGRTPEIDAPNTFVPNAVVTALGEVRWKQVVASCTHALQALSVPGQVPAWDCIRSVPELKPLLPEAHGYVEALSYAAFNEQVQRANVWTFSRAAKNTLREAVRYVSAETEVSPITGDLLDIFDPFGILHPNKKDRESASRSGESRPHAESSSRRPDPVTSLSRGIEVEAIQAQRQGYPRLPRGWGPAEAVQGAAPPLKAAPPLGAGGLAS